MKYAFSCYTLFLLIILAISACKNTGYDIVETTESTTRDTASYIERMLVVDEGGHDTLLHFRFSLNTDQHYFYQNPEFLLGVSFQKTGSDPSASYGLIYRERSGKEKLDSLRMHLAPNQIDLTNYEGENTNAGMEEGWSSIQGDIPVVSALLTNTNKMKEFLRACEGPIRTFLRDRSRLKYISSSASNSYATTIEMIIEY